MNTLAILVGLAYQLKSTKSKLSLEQLIRIVPVITCFVFSIVSIYLSIQLTANIEDEMKKIVEPAPTLLAVLTEDSQVSKVYVVVEGTCMDGVVEKEAPLNLLAAFYSFNISYPNPLKSFYEFLDHVMLGTKITKPTTTLSKFMINVS